MNRVCLVALLISIASLTASAGVCPDWDAGTLSDTDSSETGISFVLDDAVDETSAEGSSEVLAYGEVTETVQTSSLTVSLSASSNDVLTGETILFEATASSSEDDVISSYEWDLDGDGVFEVTSTDSSQETAFSDDALVPVTVRVTTDAGLVETADPLNVTVVNRAPTADFTLTTNRVTEGTTLVFSDTSTDIDGEIVAWLWSFGDGTTSSERDTEHTFTSVGEYHVTLTVTDDDGDTSVWISPAILVTDAPPLASFSIRQNGTANGQPIVLAVALTDSNSGGEIVYVAWDFGDGTYAAGSPTGDGTTTHLYSAAGTYKITLYVIDSDGTMASATRTVEVF